MGRNDEYLEAFWIDPAFPDITSKNKKHSTRKADGTSPAHPEAAVFIIRDRIGFKYEREASLTDFASQREIANLLGVTVMTVNRWVRDGDLPNHARNGFSVIQLKDVLELALTKELLKPENVRTRMRIALIDDVLSDPDFAGFASKLSTKENMYVHFEKNQSRATRRGRNPPRKS